MESNTTFINYHFNNLQQHVSALKTHLQAEYEGVYAIQYHKMECHVAVKLLKW
jgi:hypothetical protein